MLNAGMYGRTVVVLWLLFCWNCRILRSILPSNPSYDNFCTTEFVRSSLVHMSCCFAPFLSAILSSNSEAFRDKGCCIAGVLPPDSGHSSRPYQVSAIASAPGSLLIVAVRDVLRPEARIGLYVTTEEAKTTSAVIS